MIIGITGKNGSGKTTTAKYLKTKGFIYNSLSDILREKLKEEGIEENIDNLLALGNRLRREHGPGVLGKMTLEKIKKNNEKMATADSIRHPLEVNELKKAEDFVLFAIDAPIEWRYERTARRGRPGDSVSFKKFKAQEELQLNGDGPEVKLLNCISLADYKIKNDKKFEDLYQKIEEILEKIKRKDKKKPFLDKS